MANLLIQRPLNDRDVYGFLNLANFPKPAPAIILKKAGQGLVIYFAFPPEYLVSKEFNPGVTLVSRRTEENENVLTRFSSFWDHRQGYNGRRIFFRKAAQRGSRSRPFRCGSAFNQMSPVSPCV